MHPLHCGVFLATRQGKKRGLQETRGLCEKVHPDCLAMSRRRLEPMEFKATGMMLRHPNPTDQRLCCQGAHFDLPFVGLATAIATSHLGKAAPCPASHHTCQGICGKPPSDGHLQEIRASVCSAKMSESRPTSSGLPWMVHIVAGLGQEKGSSLARGEFWGKTESLWASEQKFYIPCEDYGRQWADDF